MVDSETAASGHLHRRGVSQIEQPASRAQLFRRFRGLEIPECPFVNLPELKSGR